MLFFFVIFFVDFLPTFDIIMSAERLRSEPKRYIYAKSRHETRVHFVWGVFFFPMGNPGAYVGSSQLIFPSNLSLRYSFPLLSRALRESSIISLFP